MTVKKKEQTKSRIQCCSDTLHECSRKNLDPKLECCTQHCRHHTDGIISVFEVADNALVTPATTAWSLRVRPIICWIRNAQIHPLWLPRMHLSRLGTLERSAIFSFSIDVIGSRCEHFVDMQSSSSYTCLFAQELVTASFPYNPRFRVERR